MKSQTLLLLLFSLFLTLFSCDYVKKRAIKDKLIESYSARIESLKIEIERQKIQNEMIIQDHESIMLEKKMYETAISLKEEFNQDTKDYKFFYDQLNSDLKRITSLIPDTANKISSFNKQIEYYKTKIEQIKKYKFDYDSELKEISELSKANSKKLEEEMILRNQYENDQKMMEERRDRMIKLEEETRELLMKKLNKHPTTKK